MSSRAAPRFLRRLLDIIEVPALSYPARSYSPRCSSAVKICLRPDAQSEGAYGRPAYHRSVLRPSSTHQYCSSAASEDKSPSHDEDTTARALAQTILKLQHDALEISSNGHPEKASKLLDDAATLVADEPNVGSASQAGAGIFMTHATVLLRAGMFEKLGQISENIIPELEKTAGGEIVLAMAWLRLGCARMGLGSIRESADALRSCSEVLETHAQDADDDALPAFLFSELQFYSILLNLYIAKNAQDVHDLENALLASISGMADAAPQGSGPDWPFLVSALHAHSKLLHHAIDSDAAPDIIHALFKQILLLHRAVGCGPEDLSLVQYQYGTWVYAETDDLQRARDLIQESTEELERVNPMDEGGADAGDNEEDQSNLTEEEQIARGNWNHLSALRRFRMAIIDSVMVATNARAGTPELSRETQGALSTLAATYDDLLGEENAISAEARFALSLWGVQEGLRATEETREAVEANMRRCLHVLARCMPGGKDHMLVQRLLRVYEQVVGPYELVEEEEGGGGGAGGGVACGHDHAHKHVEEERAGDKGN